MNTASNRQYQVVTTDGNPKTDVDGFVYDKQVKINVEAILSPPEDAWEFVYALAEMVDEVLDLKVGESMYFQPNRDHKTSKGIVLRIK